MKMILSLFLSLSLAVFAAAQTDSSKPAPEMERLIKMWAGHWTTVEQFEPSAEMPQGKQDKGAETMRPGPGGLSIIGDYESHGAFFGHMVVTWIPKEKVYKSYWHDLSQPGVSISTGRWEGNRLVFTSVDESTGTKLQVRDTYSDITPTSFTDTPEASLHKKSKVLVQAETRMHVRRGGVRSGHKTHTRLSHLADDRKVTFYDLFAQREIDLAAVFQPLSDSSRPQRALVPRDIFHHRI